MGPHGPSERDPLEPQERQMKPQNPPEILRGTAPGAVGAAKMQKNSRVVQVLHVSKFILPWCRPWDHNTMNMRSVEVNGKTQYLQPRGVCSHVTICGIAMSAIEKVKMRTKR